MTRVSERRLYWVNVHFKACHMASGAGGKEPDLCWGNIEKSVSDVTEESKENESTKLGRIDNNLFDWKCVPGRSTLCCQRLFRRKLQEAAAGPLQIDLSPSCTPAYRNRPLLHPCTQRLAPAACPYPHPPPPHVEAEPLMDPCDLHVQP